MTADRDLIRRLRDALDTAAGRYSMIAPDIDPDDPSDDDDDDPLREEIQEIDAAIAEADAYLASTFVPAIDE